MEDHWTKILLNLLQRPIVKIKPTKMPYKVLPFIIVITLYFSPLLLFVSFANATANMKGRTLAIPNNPLTPLNQSPVTSLSRSQIANGLELPKNLIIATCLSSAASATTGCPPIVGTTGPDIIIATAVNDATVYGLDGNDVIQCGPGTCKIYSGNGDNILMSGSSTTAQLYGGAGNNMFIGGSGDTLMVGGKGNDQMYAGSGHDIMIGGGGNNYFDCGASGNGIILDFNANTDTKAGNYKYAMMQNTGISTLP